MRGYGKRTGRSLFSFPVSLHRRTPLQNADIQCPYSMLNSMAGSLFPENRDYAITSLEMPPSQLPPQHFADLRALGCLPALLDFEQISDLLSLDARFL